MSEFRCDVCFKVVNHDQPHTTGYGLSLSGKKICYACCADIDRKEMDELIAALDRGEKVKAFILYLSNERTITNWPGTLCITIKNLGKNHVPAFGHSVSRYDVWFADHNGREWHGVNKGDNQILRCKPLKKRGK